MSTRVVKNRECEYNMTHKFLVDEVPQVKGSHQSGIKLNVDSQPNVVLKVAHDHIDQEMDYEVYELGESTRGELVLGPGNSEGSQSLCASVEVGGSKVKVKFGLEKKANFQFDDGKYGDLDGQPAPPSGQF